MLGFNLNKKRLVELSCDSMTQAGHTKKRNLIYTVTSFKFLFHSSFAPMAMVSLQEPSCKLTVNEINSMLEHQFIKFTTIK